MAFTNDYDITIPAGTEDISQGDDRIRAFKADLEERLEAMFYGFDSDSTSGDESTAGAKALNFKEQASIATPSADQITLAAKEAGGKAELHVKDEDGDEFQITTGGKIGGSNVKLTAGKSLTGSSTSDININNKFTVAGATGNTSVGGTFESVGVATLADTSVTKTTAAPGEDAEIANKKYVDDRRHGYIMLQDLQTSGTAGQTIATTGTWTKVRVSTKTTDTGSNCSLASDVITLDAGTYECDIVVPGVSLGTHRARLRDTTGSITLVTGNNNASQDGDFSGGNSFIMGRFTLGSESALEIQITNSATGVLGQAVSDAGESECYAVAVFRKIN